jgi:hypothetical protein
MNDESKIMPRDPGPNGSVELFSPASRFPRIDLSPREPHLYDYLLILRKVRPMMHSATLLPAPGTWEVWGLLEAGATLCRWEGPRDW